MLRVQPDPPKHTPRLTARPLAPPPLLPAPAGSTEEVEEGEAVPSASLASISSSRDSTTAPLVVHSPSCCAGNQRAGVHKRCECQGHHATIVVVRFTSMCGVVLMFRGFC